MLGRGSASAAATAAARWPSASGRLRFRGLRRLLGAGLVRLDGFGRARGRLGFARGPRARCRGQRRCRRSVSVASVTICGRRGLGRGFGPLLLRRPGSAAASGETAGVGVSAICGVGLGRLGGRRRRRAARAAAWPRRSAAPGPAAPSAASGATGSGACDRLRAAARAAISAHRRASAAVGLRLGRRRGLRRSASRPVRRRLRRRLGLRRPPARALLGLVRRRGGRRGRRHHRVELGARHQRHLGHRDRGRIIGGVEEPTHQAPTGSGPHARRPR